MNNLFKKHKNLIIFLALVLLLVPAISPALALEVTYPTIPGAPAITADSSFLDYINYFFTLSVMAAGIAAVISIVYSGAKILLYSAGGNAEAVGDARKNIIGSILGIALLLTSFIILKTINTEFVHPTSDSLALAPGLYYMATNPDSSTDPNAAPYIYQEAKDDSPDTSEIDPDYKWLFYNCGDGSNGRAALIWIYNDTDWKIDRTANGTSAVTTVRVPCSSPTNGVVTPNIATSIPANGVLPPGTNAISLTNVTSFAWGYEDPGVYFYLTDNCTGISSYPLNRNTTIPPFDYQTGPNFPQTARSMRIVNGNENNQKFGVVLLGETDPWTTSSQDGECSLPIINTGFANTCNGNYNSIGCCVGNSSTDIQWPNDTTTGNYFAPTAAYILNVRTNNVPNLGGVTIFNDYRRTTISQSLIEGTVPYQIPDTSNPKNLNNILRGGNNPPLPVAQKYNPDNPPGGLNDECPLTVNGNPTRTCLTGIEFTRNAYYTIVYSSNSSEIKTCQFFTQNVTDIQYQPVLSYYRDIYQVYIVPNANYSAQ